MRERFIRLSGVLALGIATSAAAADIESIAECAREQQQAHMAGIDNYAIVMEMMGHTVPQYFERVGLAGPTGASYEDFVMVPPDEIARRQDQQGMTPQALDAYADDIDAKYQMMVSVLREDTTPGPVTSWKNALKQPVYRGVRGEGTNTV